MVFKVFAGYLLQRVADKEAPFQLRLHLIYLINDVLHHCQRKNVEGWESFKILTHWWYPLCL